VSRAVNWSGELRTSDGKVGLLLPAVAHETRRRVAFQRNGHRIAGSLSEGRDVTTWLYSEDGCAGVCGQKTEMDIVS
jgi:hypothetical protein